LADRLRDATRALHAEAERAGIMRELLNGRISRAHYCLLLGNLHAIYTALESALSRHATHPCIAPLMLTGLLRAGALAADLRTLRGEGWAEDFATSPASDEYVARLDEIARTAPELLVAHAYTRYLGDLNGGQILRTVVARALELGEDDATSFYDFGGPGNAALLAKRFRSALDALPLDWGTVDMITAEARYAFALHVRLFEELASASPKAAPAQRR
jgi:heme oxygenase